MANRESDRVQPEGSEDRNDRIDTDMNEERVRGRRDDAVRAAEDDDEFDDTDELDEEEDA
jgi:hypothetical protein